MASAVSQTAVKRTGMSDEPHLPGTEWCFWCGRKKTTKENRGIALVHSGEDLRWIHQQCVYELMRELEASSFEMGKR
jgi:hypothetical protein